MKNLKDNLDIFRLAMEAKFIKVEAKHRGESVTDDKIDWLSFDWEGIRRHFWEEIGEAAASPRDPAEWIDVANLAFLLWWKAEHVLEIS